MHIKQLRLRESEGALKALCQRIEGKKATARESDSNGLELSKIWELVTNIRPLFLSPPVSGERTTPTAASKSSFEGSCPQVGLSGGTPQGPALQETLLPRLLLKSPPRRITSATKDIPRQEMGRRHHECLITLIVQVQRVSSVFRYFMGNHN